jgi:hypothetical protein
MNYLVYHRDQLLRRFNTMDEAIAHARNLRRQWVECGNDRMHYRVCYNGWKSVCVFNTADEAKCMTH